jgi:hypothetical protein
MPKFNFSFKLKYISYLIIFIIAMTIGAGSSHAAAYVKWECGNQKDHDLCARDGGVKYIYIYDEIDYQTSQAVDRVNGRIPLNRPFPIVYVNTPGGLIDEAMHIGRILRQRSARVEGMDMFHPENTPMCDSACVLLAAGATDRNLIEVGFHRGDISKRLKGERYAHAPMSDEQMAPMFDYLHEMGMKNDIANMIKNTPNDKMKEYYLSLDEPFSQQEIVKLGFRSREPVGEERSRLLKLTLLHDYGDEGLEAAALSGDDEAAFTLGHRLFVGAHKYSKNIQKGLYFLEKSAELGNEHALHMLGVIYRDYSDQVTINYEKSFNYFLRGAKLGFGPSQNNLGWMYYKGEGTRKNISEAIYWLTKAVDRGEVFAYGSLGTVRLEGNGFIQDDIETYKLFKLAISKMPKGNARDDEQKRLEAVKARMSDAQISQAEALAKEWKPLKGVETVMRDKDDR